MSDFILHTGSVPAGRLELDDAHGFRDDVRQFTGKRVDVIVREHTNTMVRTAAQYAYLWGYVYPEIADQTGYSLREVDVQSRRNAIHRVHNSMKWAFNPIAQERIDLATREVVTEEVAGSTTRLSRKKLAEFTENVKAWWAEHMGVIFYADADAWIAANPEEVERFYKVQI